MLPYRKALRKTFLDLLKKVRWLNSWQWLHSDPKQQRLVGLLSLLPLEKVKQEITYLTRQRLHVATTQTQVIQLTTLPDTYNDRFKGPDSEMDRPSPRPRGAASTSRAFVQMNKMNKGIQTQRGIFSWPTRHTAWQAEVPAGFQAPGWPHCTHFCVRHRTHNHVWRILRACLDKRLVHTLCYQLSKAFISLLTSFPTWKQKSSSITEL